jgi:hypothetical protein
MHGQSLLTHEYRVTTKLFGPPQGPNSVLKSEKNERRDRGRAVVQIVHKAC